MALTASKLDQLLNAYGQQDVEELGMTLHDQLTIEQIKLLRSIKNQLRFFVILTVIGIAAILLSMCV